MENKGQNDKGPQRDETGLKTADISNVDTAPGNITQVVPRNLLQMQVPNNLLEGAIVAFFDCTLGYSPMQSKLKSF